MIDLTDALKTYYSNIDPSPERLAEYVEAYEEVVNKFGTNPNIEPGMINLLGWKIDYTCGAAIGNFIDQILIRRLNDFIPTSNNPIILDCGANIGFNTLNYHRQYPHSKIIAFEPDPLFLPLLKRNISNNNIYNVEIVEAAVWIKNDTIDWFIEGVDGSRIATENDSNRRKTTVKTIDLNEYLNQPIDLLKLDIEGAEYSVISHISNKLHNINALSIECHLDQNTYTDFADLIVLLKKHGFNVDIGTFGLWRDLLRQHSVDSDHHENYVLVSASKHKYITNTAISTWLPSIGIGPIIEHLTQLKHVCDNLVSKSQAESDKKINNLEKYLLKIKKSGSNSVKELNLKKPFVNDGGNAWTTYLPGLKNLSDNLNNPFRSPVLLFENDLLIGVAHAFHDDIRNNGKGLYSHWDSTVYFSTSDNSDPNTNNRIYSLLYFID